MEDFYFKQGDGNGVRPNGSECPYRSTRLSVYRESFVRILLFSSVLKDVCLTNESYHAAVKGKWRFHNSYKPLPIKFRYSLLPY